MTDPQDYLFLMGSSTVSVESTALFGRRRPSPKQSAILAELRKKPEITLAEAMQLIGGNLYCNAEKHVGVTLSNMVQRGMIDRVKPGVFCLPNAAPDQTADQGCSVEGMVDTLTPIRGCAYQDTQDGTCSHPDNITPECHAVACPRLQNINMERSDTSDNERSETCDVDTRPHPCSSVSIRG